MSAPPNRLEIARDLAAIEYEKAAVGQASLTVVVLHRATAARIRDGKCDHNPQVRHHLAEQTV